MHVLLVVDMQKALFETPRFNAQTVVSNINRVAAATRRSTGRVIHVQHNGSAAEGLYPHTDGWSLLDALHVDAADTVIGKTICDSFFATGLSDVLTRLAPDQVIVAGCASEFCVDTTIRSAVSHGFPVVAVADGHTTADRPHLDAKAIIEHHNWVWKNLITPKTAVSVKTADEICAEIGG